MKYDFIIKIYIQLILGVLTCIFLNTNDFTFCLDNPSNLLTNVPLHQFVVQNLNNMPVLEEDIAPNPTANTSATTSQSGVLVPVIVTVCIFSFMSFTAGHYVGFHVAMQQVLTNAKNANLPIPDESAL